MVTDGGLLVMSTLCEANARFPDAGIEYLAEELSLWATRSFGLFDPR
jgi:hypothetical protein